MYKKKNVYVKKEGHKIYIHICTGYTKINKLEKREKTWQMGDRYEKFFILYLLIKE